MKIIRFNRYRTISFFYYSRDIEEFYDIDAAVINVKIIEEMLDYLHEFNEFRFNFDFINASIPMARDILNKASIPV